MRRGDAPDEKVKIIPVDAAVYSIEGVLARLRASLPNGPIDSILQACRPELSALYWAH